MTGYNYFYTLEQVTSWARYLVDNGHKKESDFTMQRIRWNGPLLNRDWAFEQAARLAAEYPNEYITWCTLQRLTGKRGSE